MNPEELRQFLSDTLMDIPLSRKQSEQQALSALFRGCIAYPVFPSQDSVVPSWLKEAIPLANKLDDVVTYELLRVRRAVVAMRLKDLDAALTEVQELTDQNSDERIQHYACMTMARVLTRQQQFNSAEQYLEKALAIEVAEDDWLAGMVTVAKAELNLEQDKTDAASSAFRKALDRLPEWAVEERVQSLQSLAFIASTKLEVNRALKYFSAAADLLDAASIWPELVQMQLAVASLLITKGKAQQATTMFEQAREICLTHDLRMWLTPIEVGLARATRSLSDPEQAKQKTMELASECAKRGDTTGFISMVVLLAGIDIDEKEYESAYRVLTLGQSISKYLKLPTAVGIFRAQINRLRDENMGGAAFEKMAEKLLSEARGRKLH